jgi:hypothetical protein
MTSKVACAVLLVCLFATCALATTQDDRHHHHNNNNNHHNHNNNNKCFECKAGLADAHLSSRRQPQ